MVFFKYFEPSTIKSCHRESSGESQTIDPKCLEGVTIVIEERPGLAAKAAAYSVFASAAGRCAGWFTGCPCHDHIWTQNITLLQQMKLFREETGGNIEECVWRGRRSNELARGHWKVLITQIQEADSTCLQERLSALAPAARGRVAQMFRSFMCLES